MITTRERVTLAELWSGVRQPTSALTECFRGLLPLDGRQCVFTNQGKAAFEQIVLAAGLANSRIIVPAFFPDDFVGLYRKYSMTPVFVDVDPETYQLDLGAVRPEHLAGAKSMLLLHTFGLPADGRTYRRFCDEHGLVLIEDCARALGAAYRNELAGSFGHYALFSLPKCTPVREGGIAIAERPMRPALEPARLGMYGLLHALTLVKWPFVEPIESAIYARVADTPVYPREVGIYDPRPGRELDAFGQAVLRGYMPHYRAAVDAKRRLANHFRQALCSRGFKFQHNHGGHVYTAVAIDPPPAVDSDRFQAFLHRNGVKVSAMWRGALGMTELAAREWGADPEATPVARRLSTRLLQLPVNRFQTPGQTEKIVRLCEQFSS